MENSNLVKRAKELLEHHLPLIMDKNDWHYAHGLIDMVEGLGLLTKAEARDYRVAADAMRKAGYDG